MLSVFIQSLSLPLIRKKKSSISNKNVNLLLYIFDLRGLVEVTIERQTEDGNSLNRGGFTFRDCMQNACQWQTKRVLIHHLLYLPIGLWICGSGRSDERVPVVLVGQ